MIGDVAALALIHAQFSLLAVGGVVSILPEMQRQVVEVRHWMTAADFASLYALAQAAPGPNMLIATLIGWHVAGLPGALVATASLCAPSCLLTFFTYRLWNRFRHAAWRQVIQAGLVPVTVGLVMAAAVLLLAATATSWPAAGIAAVATVLFLFTRIHPLLVLFGAAALGAAGVS